MISGLGGRVVWLGLRVDWGTFVFDISNVTVVVVSSIGNSLDTAIGKGNLVRSSNGFAISSFLSTEFSTRVAIVNTVLESIRLGGFVIDRGGMRGSISWGSSREGRDGSHKGNKNGEAKHDK